MGGDGFPDSLMLAVELIDGDEGMIRVSKRVTWRLCIFPLVYAPDAEAKFHSVTLVHDPSSMNRTFLFDGAKIHGVDGLESMKEMFRKSKVRGMPRGIRRHTVCAKRYTLKYTTRDIRGILRVIY